MSAEQLSRERGVLIKCDYGHYDDEPTHCSASHYTASIRVSANRSAASKVGWIRGGEGRKRRDYCPVHAPFELARLDEEQRVKDEAQKERDGARAAKRAAAAAAPSPAVEASPA